MWTPEDAPDDEICQLCGGPVPCANLGCQEPAQRDDDQPTEEYGHWAA